MINGTKVLRDDKTRWITINVPETRWAAPRTASTPSIVGCVTGIRRWITSIPRRIGALLFVVNDAEARWRGWTITELRGGLARRYRDPRFDTWTGMPGGDAEDDESERSP
jgi:hypothetical protein